MTKHELQQYRWAQKNIDRLEERLLELETEATRITTRLTKDPKGGGSVDKISALVAQVMDTRDKINARLHDAYNMQVRIEVAIGALPEREKYLIRARYLEGKSWEQIAVDMSYSWQWVHRIHSRALKMISRKCSE